IAHPMANAFTPFISLTFAARISSTDTSLFVRSNNSIVPGDGFSSICSPLTSSCLVRYFTPAMGPYWKRTIHRNTSSPAAASSPRRPSCTASDGGPSHKSRAPEQSKMIRGQTPKLHDKFRCLSPDCSGPRDLYHCPEVPLSIAPVLIRVTFSENCSFYIRNG